MPCFYCNQAACSGCAECSGDAPTCPEARPTTCNEWCCPDESRNWWTKYDNSGVEKDGSTKMFTRTLCRWSGCEGCNYCETYYCPTFCTTMTHPWEKKCTWEKCGLCIECDADDATPAIDPCASDDDDTSGDDKTGDDEPAGPVNLEFGTCGTAGYTDVEGWEGELVYGSGPTIEECNSAYQDDRLESVTDGIQQWKVPKDAKYQITCAGAKGGSISTDGGKSGGKGAKLQANFDLTQGDNIWILVGQTPSGGSHTSGGGGGTYVMTGDAISSATPLLVCGGGGGAGDSGKDGQDAVYTEAGSEGAAEYPAGINGYGSADDSNGGWGSSGAGYRGDGSETNYNGPSSTRVDAKSFHNKGHGATGFLDGGSCDGNYGGFGGGGAGACNGGGGGGGYSGGGSGGGGGGSYSSSADGYVEDTDNMNDGNGSVTIAEVSTDRRKI